MCLNREVYVNNTVEGQFSILKRDQRRLPPRLPRTHLDRPLSEFDFRYKPRRNLTDSMRSIAAPRGRRGQAAHYRCLSR
jgi:hypothetical protein